MQIIRVLPAGLFLHQHQHGLRHPIAAPGRRRDDACARHSQAGNAHQRKLAAFQDPLGIGNFLSLLLCVGAEFGCSILIFLGLFTRLASLLLIINMCVALFLVLGLSGWGAQELAAIYLLIYLTLFYTGPGKFSLDAWWLWRDCKIEVE